MTSGLNYCIGGGYVVGQSYELPDDPSAYHSNNRDIIGCNNLVCAACGAKVRSLAGFTPAPPPTVRWRDVYEAQDWSALGWLHPSSGRMYVCRCLHLTELHAEPSNQLEETRGVRWECAGHAPSSLPLEIDGNQITRFTDIPNLLRKAATRVLKLPLAKIHARLRGTPLQLEVERVVQTFLTDDDPNVRRVALGFFWGHPDAAGATAVLALAEGDRALFRGVPDEALSEGNDLEARLILTLGQLWISNAVNEERARELLRAEVMKPGRLRPALASLARKDTEWLMQHAETILGVNQEQLGKLIVELERVLGPDPMLLELARRSRPADAEARSAARNDIETYVTTDLREPLLAILA
jgi:hypothetical protein